MNRRRQSAQSPSQAPSGGDQAEKLSQVPSMRLDDEDERPSREDMSYGSTIFTRSPVPLPRFLRGGKKRRPR
jgi:hypothetical protein